MSVDDDSDGLRRRSDFERLHRQWDKNDQKNDFFIFHTIVGGVETNSLSGFDSSRY